MAYEPRYASLYHLRNRGVPKDFLDDSEAIELLADISRWVDDHCGQIFYPRYQSLDLDGMRHRLLRHPQLLPIIELSSVTEVTSRTRVFDWTYSPGDSLYTLTTDQYSLDNAIPSRYINKTFGVWNEGNNNYRVVAWWGWLASQSKVEYTTAAIFNPGDALLYLTDVSGLRVHDVGTLEDETVLTIVEINVAGNYVTVDGGDLATVAAASGETFTRWGQVPGSIRKFVLESAFMSSGVAYAENDGMMKREKTDNYEYERFSPKDMGMIGGEFWTGNMMIDAGLSRYCRPPYIGLV